MESLTRQTITCIFLISCSPVFTLKSQTIDKKTSTSSVSGNVTIKEKGVAGVTVVLSQSNRSDPATYHAKTDQDGRYRIMGVPPGSYEIRPETPSFSVYTKSGNATLIIGEGESVEDINFALKKGGVITGRVTNSESLPLIEQYVTLSMVEINPNNDRNLGIVESGMSGVTDDRGVYRIFGVRPGKYKVSVGLDQGRRPGRRVSIRPTFYPDVSDVSKATIVEVSEGGEATSIDITVDTNDTSPKFSVSGRVVDGSTGQPTPNVGIDVHGLNAIVGQALSFVSDAEGQFKVDGLPPGKYQLSVANNTNNSLRADPLQFEINDGNVNGLVVKTFKAVNLSGQVVFEGNDKQWRPKPGELVVAVNVQHATGGSGRTLHIAEDWTFQVGGLREGTVNFEGGWYRGDPTKGFAVSRIERDGVVQPRGIEVKDGDQVTGVKVFVNSRSGTIRGVVKFVNGELPPSGRISVWLTNSDQTRVQHSSTQVDSRGHFVVEGIPAGNYELNVSVELPNQGRRTPATKQQVTVTDGAVSEVTLTVDLSPGP